MYDIFFDINSTVTESEGKTDESEESDKKEHETLFSKSADEGYFLNDDRKDRISDAQRQVIIRTILKLKSGKQFQKIDREERGAALRRLKGKGLSVRLIEYLTRVIRGVVFKA